jgi:transcription elongation factor Elf1
LWKPIRAGMLAFRLHIEGMTSGTWTTERFECPKCGMWYRATKEQDPEPQPGSFSCTECNTEILSWSGIDRYFDWQQITMRPKGGA